MTLPCVTSRKKTDAGPGAENDLTPRAKRWEHERSRRMRGVLERMCGVFDLAWWGSLPWLSLSFSDFVALRDRITNL